MYGMGTYFASENMVFVKRQVCFFIFENVFEVPEQCTQFAFRQFGTKSDIFITPKKYLTLGLNYRTYTVIPFVM
jgi:hypothetical protein